MDEIDREVHRFEVPIAIEFDLFVIGDWSGNDESAGSGGADVLELAFATYPLDRHTIFMTSFSNLAGSSQAFPGTFRGGAFDAGTGAAEHNTLGYGLDSVYHIRQSWLSPFSPSWDVFYYITVSGLDEGASWGVDNIFLQWITIPEPSSIVLASLGLVALISRRVTKRRSH